MRRCEEKGMALILALAAVLIISIMLSGMMLLSVSHYSLSNTNSDHANALHLAEAGINWELNKIADDPASADNTAVSVEYPTGSGRAFEVYVRDYVTGGTWDWRTSAPLWVISTGTVDGVSRTVRIKAQGRGLFGPEGPYALFGINSLSVGGNLNVIGASGTDGDLTVHGSSVLLDGDFYYCGVPGGPLVPGDGRVTGDVLYSPLPEKFPTVNEYANMWALERYSTVTTAGIDFFADSTYNSNDTLVDSTGASVTIPPGNPRLDTAVFKKTSGIIEFWPGDYYFVSLDLPSNNEIVIHNEAGVVNIWLGPEAGTGGFDSINGTMRFVSDNVTNFHLYVGSKRPLRLNGTMDYYGSFFAYNGPDKFGDYYGSLQVLGDGYINGSVIGYDVVKAQGSAVIEFPSTGGGGPPPPGDPSPFFGFDREWEELNPL
jgi:hypothetical protein